jgi:hypothetical protein
MNTSTDTTRADRLYALLPTVHRMRDADQGYPLKALLRVIAEQVGVVEDDIAQLYDDWFIETAQDWAVPYIGELVGYVPVADAGLPADTPACENPRVLVPRREVANQIRIRRAKGTLALLEQLALDVAGWPARAVEFFKLLSRHQNINHLYLDRHRIADLRDMDGLDRLAAPEPAGDRHAGLLCRGRGTRVLHVRRARPGRAAVRRPAARDRSDAHRRRAEPAGTDPPPRLRRRPRRLLRKGIEPGDPRRRLGGCAR